MGNRLSKIVTRTGDGGETGLANGDRIPKNAPRIHAIGEVDELNSWLGLLATELDPCYQTFIQFIQQQLFNVGGQLALPEHTLFKAEPLAELEQYLQAWNATLPPLKEFILPGGSKAASLCHLARAVCRRAERQVISLHQLEPINAPVIAFLNRLSDALFVLARVLNATQQQTEVLWDHQRGKS